MKLAVFETQVNGDAGMVSQMGSSQEHCILDLEDESLIKHGPNDRGVLYTGAAPNRHYSFSLSLEDCGWKEIWNIMLNRTKKVFSSSKINLLVPCGPLAVLVDLVTGHQGSVFLLSLLGTIPLAERLGWVTEQLAFYTGPTAGGLLIATFGNATELIISIHAMTSGMISVVQQSLLGSILSNMLLANAEINTGLLLVAVMGLLFPAVLHFTRTELNFGKSELALSRFSSCVMLVAYVASLCFQLNGQRNLSVPVNEVESQADGSSDDKEAPEITRWESIIWLLILTALISYLSEYIVHAMEGASVALDIPVAFISVIVLPIVGNAAEHASAVMFAMKDKLDMSLGVVIGSATQISMFGSGHVIFRGYAQDIDEEEQKLNNVDQGSSRDCPVRDEPSENLLISRTAKICAPIYYSLHHGSENRIGFPDLCSHSWFQSAPTTDPCASSQLWWQHVAAATSVMGTEL
ncbi:hypothetical protein Vadar_010581 [Vaccinium darrowii]|uniref:Uncharacterized protein n=1 Tax=Vaccinium darrowii TaxID=229202 RepID=A0ACB7Z5G2_9ERIC|nr:hypothetical protein Vadar_010581 [Vaccinium darrowii]